MSKSREYQSLNKMFRTRLHLEFQVDTYYGLNPTPQSPIGSVCVDVKGIGGIGIGIFYFMR